MTIIKMQTMIDNRVLTVVAGVPDGENPVGKAPMRQVNVAVWQNACHCTEAIVIIVKDHNMLAEPARKGHCPMVAVTTPIHLADLLQGFEICVCELHYWVFS